MKKEILILPSFNNFESVSTILNRSIALHRKLAAKHQHEWIPRPDYRLYVLHEIEELYNSHFTYPEDSVLRILSESGETIQGSELAGSFEVLKETVDFIKAKDNQNHPYQRKFDEAIQRFQPAVANLKGASNILPVLTIEWNEELSLEKEHIAAMGNGKWIKGLLEFLKWATHEGIAIDSEKVTIDSFLFQKNGIIVKFLQYDALSFIGETLPAFKKNIEVVEKLLEEFYAHYYHQPGNWEDTPKQNRTIDRFYPYIENGKGKYFSGFDELLDVYHGRDVKKSAEQRIGVFIDVANFYHDLGDYQIDFDGLFTTIYLEEETKFIKDKFAFFFIPANTDVKQKERHRSFQKPLIANLKAQGFSMNDAENDRLKAKEIVDGLVKDADDFKLIQRMEERLPFLSGVLLLSGDKDYLEILRKYKEKGKQVKVISAHPDSTSKQIIEEFDHQYITVYWENIVT